MKTNLGSIPALFRQGYDAAKAEQQFEETRLRDALTECAKQFRFYEHQHLSKSPPDIAKAETNRFFAERCEAVLEQATTIL